MAVSVPMNADHESALARRGPALALVLAFLHCLSFSWLKWGDVVVDCTRELDIAQQIAEGRMLYRDIACDVGPLSPYLNGLLFRCFGVHLDVMLVMGILTAGAMCMLLYLLACRFLGRWSAALIGAGFLYMCAFAHLTANGIFNFVFPYRTSATYGIVLLTASLFFLVRHVQEGRRADMIVSWLFLALTALSKHELVFAGVVTHGLFILGWLLNRPRRWRMYLCGYAIVAAAVFGVYAFFVWRAAGRMMGAEHASFIAALSQRYMRLHMGLTDVPASLLAMLYSSLLVLGVAGFALVLGRWVCPVRPAGVPPASETAQAAGGHLRLPVTRGEALCCAAAAIAGGSVYFLMTLELPFRFLPVLGTIVLLALAYRYCRHPEEREVLGPELLVWGCAVACLPRMGLVTISYHYGFFLLPIGLLALGLLWFRQLPRWLGPYVRSRAVFALAGAGMFLGLSAAHLTVSLAQYREHTVVMNAPRGRLLLYNPPRRFPAGQCYADAIDLLSQMPPATRAIVVPQGVGLTFFSGLANPFGVSGYVELEFKGSWTDEAVLEMFKAAPPDLVVLVASDLSEHGSGVFGKTYAVKSWEWIAANYKPCVLIGRRFIEIRCRSDVDPSPMLNRLHAAPPR